MTKVERRERRRQWLRSGGWYFVVTAASAGILAWVPFVHAGTRLGWSRPLVRNAVLFAVAAAVIGVLISAAPTGPDGQPATGAGQVLSSIGAGLAMVLVAVACLLQAPLRRQVFFGEQPKPAGPPVDPAIAAVLAARKRREEARELVRTDPMMARELHIGRPDLNGTYDDGGLVDLASAPAPVIAEVCEIDVAAAQAIVDMRDSGIGLHTVDDVFSLTNAPLAAWDRIRDRAVLLG